MSELLELLNNSGSAAAALYFIIAIAAGFGAVAQANLQASNERDSCARAVFKITDLIAIFFVALLWPIGLVITIGSVLRYSVIAEISN